MSQTILKMKAHDEDWDRQIKTISQETELKVLVNKNITEEHSFVENVLTTNLTVQELECLPNLKNIFLYKTGMDGLPLDIIKERGITVYPSHANSGVIAEHAVSLALALLHRITEFHNDMIEGIWFSDGINYKWQTLSGCNVGIIGYGHIGRQIVKLLKSFNVNFYCFNESKSYDDSVFAIQGIEELISKTKVIFVCLPKDEKTIGMIDETVLNSMNDKYLINIGRAEVIDESALYKALSENILAGFASDVWYKVPDKTDRKKRAEFSSYPFESLHNVVLSPHCATHEVKAHRRYVDDCINNFLNNKDKI